MSASMPRATEKRPTMPMMATVRPRMESSERVGRLNRFCTPIFHIVKPVSHPQLEFVAPLRWNCSGVVGIRPAAEFEIRRLSPSRSPSFSLSLSFGCTLRDQPVREVSNFS
ncbi:MAG: hypothetical protein WD065_16085, partial [Planctomycetaceae bacterium]